MYLERDVVVNVNRNVNAILVNVKNVVNKFKLNKNPY